MGDRDIKPELKKLIIDVRARELDRAVNFYEQILGLPLMQRASDWASFEANGAEIHLYLQGGAEFGIEFRVADIKKEIKLLKTRGVRFFIAPDAPNLLRTTGDVMEFPWGKAAYFKDSEGNDIAIVEDE